MTDADKLIILKKDLQMISNTNDEYLSKLLEFSKALMIQEGINYIQDDIGCEMINIHYAAYLFRRRGGSETNMPRFLRWELNNLLFSQKGKANDV
jgi:glutathione synthase/RimK-type ligase-like ATP-grasp enzyme